MLTWRGAVDYIVLCAAFYVLLRWAARARALRLALTITALYALSLVARDLNLIVTSWVLQVAALLSIASLLLVFQPEIRSALMRLDTKVLSISAVGAGNPTVYSAIGEAAFSLAAKRIGALIVVVKNDRIDELLEGGIPLRADVSASLLESLFQKTSPLHDGAAVVDHGRLTQANAILPLTHGRAVPPEFGTRHRAAMGLSERSDALVVAVSEERGAVSVMRRREILRVSSPQELVALLKTYPAKSQESPLRRAGHLLIRDWRYKLAAILLSTLVWAGLLFSPGVIIRTLRVPVEFTNVPRGFDIRDQSATSVEAQIRGRTWVMDNADLSRVVAQFNMSGVKEGTRILRVNAEDLDLPPGAVVTAVKPDTVTVHIVRREPPPQAR